MITNSPGLNVLGILELHKFQSDIISPHCSYTSAEPLSSSSKTHFPKGSGQVYNSAPKHKIKPSMFTEEEVSCCTFSLKNFYEY